MRLSGPQRVLATTLVLNWCVALAKAIYGGLSGSLAVQSDALHSLVDGLSNIVGLVALRWAGRGPDERHPYGYKKVETLAAMGIGFVIAIGAFQFGSGAIGGLIEGSPPPAVTWLGIAVLGGTLVVNLFVAAYEASAGRRLKSPFLIADAAHTASDVLVTCTVIASQLAAKWGLSWADPLAALFVLLMVGRIAWNIIGANAKMLLDRMAVDPERVKTTVLEVPGVEGCHRIRSRGAPQAVHVDFHLTMDPELTLAQAHEISHRAEEQVKALLPEVVDVTIHVEPRGDPEEEL